MSALFAEAYADARRLAAAETRLPLATFPLESPFTLDKVRNGGLPDEGR